MRPIEITIKGLHSFREKQTVNFSSLCEGGVFGIFGPTGSGKSSLLDAMTLALYGKVERALNNTQGIINQAEKTLSVSFAFELGHKGSASTYMVERSYKRTSEFNVKTSFCRLLDMTKEPSVLADKTNDVNNQIENLLGLSIDDFTRAVVLPQGKFSEFLKLRGNERRKMLQRLFHLEKYGDDLIKKIKKNLQDVTHEKEKIEAEQLGLGNASKEALLTVEDNLKYWDNELQQALIRKEQTEEKWEQIKQLRAWQKEKEEAYQELLELEKQAPQIEIHKNYIQQSIEAESLLPYANACLYADKEQREWKKKADDKANKLHDILVNEKHLLSQWEEFQQEKESKDEEIASIHQSIDKAEELEKEVSQYTQEKQNIEDVYKTLTNKLDEYHKEAEKINANVMKYSDAVKTLKDRQKILLGTREEKNTLFRAIQEKQHIRHLDQHLKNIKREESDRKQQTDKAFEDKKEAEQQVNKGKETLTARFSQVLYWYDKTAAEKGWIDQFLHHLQRWLKEETDKENHMKVREMSYHLSTHLKEGIPCPVCGSSEHPAPAVPEEKSLKFTDEHAVEREKLEEWISKLQSYQLVMNHREWTLQQTSSSIVDQMGEEVGASLANEEDTDDLFSLKKAVEWEEKIQRKLVQWDKEEETLSRLQKSIEKELKHYYQAIENRKQHEYECDSKYNVHKELVEKRTTAEIERDRARQKWEENFPSYSFDALEDRYETLQQNEEEGEHLQKRIEDGTKHIEDLQGRYDGLLKKLHVIEVKQIEAKTQVDQMTAFVNDRAAQLEKILQGQHLNKLKKDVNDQIAAWEKKEKNLDSELEKLKTEKQQTEQEKAVAEHSYDESVSRLEKARMVWQDKADRSTLQLHPASVSDAILSEQEKDEYEKKIKTFEQEKEKWKRIKQELVQKLSDHYVTDKEWEVWKETWHAINKKLDDLREKRGAASKSLDEIKQKHTYYNELEKERKKREEKENQYQQLDTVFRGKGFVEFIAEEQLVQVSRLASERLYTLTNGRYAIEVDSSGGFIVRDDANGGIKRPVTTLSGGETFLTSLALALALSASIQLKGQYPLEFFFLDEGFGTLDHELLETVMSALEKLQTDNLSVGVISHVPELQERLPKKLFVKPAEPGGPGSKVYIQGM
ncbi:AAA family ATPase [Alteribacillus bidgolensis]|uniref:Nuclease SbcCD subunit C n=1 Tax=Alteribacillus bidgolensis TaxID=930129 RepID=A0A1G8CGF2_9BACI|nr:SMC family ATPase [Alteribacillus bidgolensis]SDH43970.1 exonuclease SbcC [Alteribacillus bidgolensis]